MILDPCYFRNNIQFFRVLAGLTQAELADEIGVSINTISSYETGQYQPTAFRAFLLCGALNCSFDELFDYVED